ncbi:hypothetical protein BGX24_005104 [Mortierella sp. AD032]|nr:hypothetical protein BGX24_005104 [Mortierella sp. AD032]
MWLFVAAFLGGFGNGSDTTFTNFERRDRELQIRVAEQKRHEILYGSSEEQHQKIVDAANSLSTPAATAAAAAAAPAAATA